MRIRQPIVASTMTTRIAIAICRREISPHANRLELVLGFDDRSGGLCCESTEGVSGTRVMTGSVEE